jgi:HlyD family secretion protein
MHVKLTSILCGAVSLFTAALGCAPTDSQNVVLPGIVETQEVRLSSKVGGRVERVLVNEGDVVKAGQALVQLESAELDAKRAQLVAQQELFQAKLDLLCNGPLPEQIAAAKAALDMSEARLQKLQSGWRTEETEMAKYQSEMWNAEADRASREYKRLERVQGNNTISLTELDSAKAAMLRSQSQADASKKQLEMMLSGSRVEDIAEAQAAVAKSKADYELIKRGARDEEIRQAKAQLAEVVARIRELDTQIAECLIVAPDQCLIEVIGIRHGDMAPPNVPIVRVLYESDIWVKAYVPETQLGWVKLNQHVIVTHDGSHREFDGQVSHIANVSEFTPRNVQSPDERHHQVFGIKVRIKDAAGVFKSGMAATIRTKGAK